MDEGEKWQEGKLNGQQREQRTGKLYTKGKKWNEEIGKFKSSSKNARNKENKLILPF